MNGWHLIVRELLHRKVNFMLSALGVTAAVALFVFALTAGDASRRETARIQRDIGLNLRIIPKATNEAKLHVAGFSDVTMPEQYVHDMASVSGLDYAHLLPRLGRMIEWQGMEVVLIGVLPEISPVDQKKPSMSYAPKEGTVGVGYLVARDRKLAPGDTIAMLGRELRVADVFEEEGTQEDISLKAHLRDVQAMLNLPDQISEIQAINCTCFEERGDLMTQLRAQLEPVLPEAKLLLMRDAAEARNKQRHMVEDYLAWVVTVLMVLCAAWVGLLAMLNVRERLQEIGILRALGFRSSTIGMLFQGKAVIVGLIGAAVGFGVGTWVALQWGPGIFKMTGGKIAPDWTLLGWALVAAPLFALVASMVPTVMAMTHDPAETLREQ